MPKIILKRGGGNKPFLGRRNIHQNFELRGNFCNLRDSRDEVVYDPALAGALYQPGYNLPTLFDEWVRVHQKNGTTYVFVGSFEGGLAYNSADGAKMKWPNPDWRNNAPAIRAFIEKLLDTPGADGYGFGVVVFLDGGGPNPLDHIPQRWSVIAEALRGLQDNVILVPAWEPEEWHDEEFNDAMLQYGKPLFPGFTWFFHGWPGRGVMGEQNNPKSPWRKWQWPERNSQGQTIDKDTGQPTNDLSRMRWLGGEYVGPDAAIDQQNHPDPLGGWTTGEAEFYTEACGPMFSGLFYQTERNNNLLTGCDMNNEDGSCPYNRLMDYVMRCGAGMKGWRKIHMAAMEYTAWYEFRKLLAPGQTAQVATYHKQVFDAFSVKFHCGNGLPNV